MKAKLSIFSYDSLFNSDAFIYVEIPCAPSMGSLFYMRNSDDEQLINLITKDHETAYATDIYYYGFNINEIDFEAFKKIPLSEIKEYASLGDFIYVVGVGYHWDNDKNEYELWIALAD